MEGLFRMGTRFFIGVMSGTSVDAIDAALVAVTERAERYGMKVLRHAERKWPADLRRRLLKVMAPATATTAEICELNMLVAWEFAAAVDGILSATGFGRERIAAIGSHGQTICHLPPLGNKRLRSGNVKRETQNSPIGSTLQLGDVSMIATLSGLVTVGNFRMADMAVGGQGAPLVPWVDDMVLSSKTKARCVQNIGGIGNVTWLSPHTKTAAFDTGPGNMVIDAVVAMGTRDKAQFDRGGAMARRGREDAALLKWLKSHAYFARRPPKSTGREEFGMEFAKDVMRRARKRRLRLEDLVRTVTRLTAWAIADAYRRFLPAMPDEVILCGGGAENPVLVTMIAEELGREIRLRRIDEFGIPNKAKEAASFALLAAATLHGVHGNIPSVTGATEGVVLGVIAKPG